MKLSVEENLSRNPEIIGQSVTEAGVSGATAPEKDLVEDVVSKKPMDGKDMITSKEQLYNFIEFSTANPNGYSCTLCGMRGERKWHLWLHVESIHYPGIFEHTCNHCSDTFNTMGKLKGHMQKKHGSLIRKRKKKGFKKLPNVSVVGTKVIDDTNIVKQSKTTEKAKSDNEEALYKYIEVFTTDPRIYRCTICGHTSKLKQNLWVHVENIHYPGIFSHQCDQCLSTFPTKTKLSAHMSKEHRGHQIKKRSRRRKGVKTKE